MDKSVLLEKRKNLLSGSKNAPELFINNHFVDLSQLFNENDLLNFIENQAITELILNKTELLNKIAIIINDAATSNTIPDALTSLKVVNINPDDNKDDIIKKIIEQKLNSIDLLLDYSLKAKLEYYDSSVWTLYFSYGVLEGKIPYINHDDLIVRAPLINVEIEIIKNENGEIVIRKINDERVGNDILELSLDEQLEKQT
jgi:hypothetical protein